MDKLKSPKVLLTILVAGTVAYLALGCETPTFAPDYAETDALAHSSHDPGLPVLKSVAVTRRGFYRAVGGGRYRRCDPDERTTMDQRGLRTPEPRASVWLAHSA